MCVVFGQVRVEVQPPGAGNAAQVGTGDALPQVDNLISGGRVTDVRGRQFPNRTAQARARGGGTVGSARTSAGDVLRVSEFLRHEQRRNGWVAGPTQPPWTACPPSSRTRAVPQDSVPRIHKVPRKVLRWRARIFNCRLVRYLVLYLYFEGYSIILTRQATPLPAAPDNPP